MLVSDGAEGTRVVVVMLCYDFLRLPSTSCVPWRLLLVVRPL